jgi:4'-phosphopantetheinyl transferase
MTLSLPPIILWKGNTTNRCAFDEILSYWKDYDTITFLVDLGIYHRSLRTFLDPHEREKELLFKPVISQKRFVLSRTILKHILHPILQTGNIADIILIRKENGGILVKGYPAIYISLSYSGTSIAITVGKRKIGSDIELLRSVNIRKIRSYPLFNAKNCRDEEESLRHFFHAWTLVEAYAKLHDRNPYPFLLCRDLPQDADFVSYCVNNSSIFSLASGPERGKDALLWLDTTTLGISPPLTNTEIVPLDRGRGTKTVQ